MGLHIRKRMIAGLLLLLPLGITLIILRFLYSITAEFFIPILEKPFGHQPPALIIILSILAFVCLIYCMGIIGTFFIVKRLIRAAEDMLLQLPLLKTIYGAAKSIVTTFSIRPKAAFRSTVLVEFPKAGAFSIGFVTGEIADNQGRKYYKVFIPTAPNPTSGFLQIMPVEMAKPAGIPVEEAIKMILSGGIIGPEHMPL